MKPAEFDATQVNQLMVTHAHAGQRLDNLLLCLLKGVPKSHVYRIVRSGEVRINGKRCGPADRVALGDRVRVPPVRVAVPSETPRAAAPARVVTPPILYEDEHLLAVDKPSGLAVHGGSGVSLGAIEALRLARPQAGFLELVHRLDRETSGVLLIAKRRPALVEMHRLLRESDAIEKVYVTLVKGRVRWHTRTVALGLRRFVTRTGERRVTVDEEGQSSRTRFERRARYAEASLVGARIYTGRTHQLRVQLAHLDHPILGDDKYGDFELNRVLRARGLKRMFLHAESLAFPHPENGARVALAAPLPVDLQRFLATLGSAEG
jgi:23S rRNA pseudouridine955/2504/2580 synthase